MFGMMTLFQNIEICARFSCRDNRGFEMVSLAGIGGACFLGIALEGRDIFSVFS